jgi:hypothetical protein
VKRPSRNLQYDLYNLILQQQSLVAERGKRQFASFS